MDVSPDIRTQLEGLRISHDQRPGFKGSSGTRGGNGGGGKLLLALVILSGLGGGGYYAYSHKLITPAGLGTPAQASEVPLLKVSTRPDNAPPPILTATGKIVSDHKVQVMAKVSGQVVALYFEQGDRVRKGQTLARIEDVNYRAHRDEAAAGVAKAKATLEFQKYNFERISGLYQKSTAPGLEYREAQRAVREAEAAVNMGQATLDFAQKGLNDCEVTAPIAGVVLERNVEVGDFVAAEGGRGMIANAQFAIVADMSALRVEVDVSELDIARLHTAMPCTIAPDAYKDRHYTGRVMWIDPGANYSKATVQVKVRIDNPDEYLRVEGSAQVVFLPEPTTAPATQESTLWIPASAIKALDGGAAKVFVVDEGRLKETSVAIGRRSGAQIEVISGLVDGQSIAADGVDKLRDGQRVRS
jgi:HlyD family secretion protein